MDNFVCTRCGGFLTMNEYRNNICLCDRCWINIKNEFEKNDIVWNGFNNVDEILERKRVKLIATWGNVNGRYKCNNKYNA